MRIYCFDLDETLCLTEGEDYSAALPIESRISRVNSLFLEGHIVKIYTARGSKTGIDWRRTTEDQLTRWGVKYHELHFGKPFADIYIDDKAKLDKHFFGD